MSGIVRRQPENREPGTPPAKRKPDARAQRSRHSLGMALLELIMQKPYEQVTVQEVLDRSAVGRSTFYLHFRDKNDLLLSELEGFLEFMSTMLVQSGDRSLRVAPIAEMFGHIREQMELYRALARSGRLHDFYELAQGYFTRGIARRMMDSGRLKNLAPREIDARASATAGSLLALLRWWLDGGAKETPLAMDEMFHNMVWRGLRDGSSR
jgi:AcrR family transcriptional regulator